MLRMQSGTERSIVRVADIHDVYDFDDKICVVEAVIHVYPYNTYVILGVRAKLGRCVAYQKFWQSSKKRPNCARTPCNSSYVSKRIF